MIIATRASSSDCSEVNVDCPVSGSIYGYAPNIAASYAFCIIFGVCGLVQAFQMMKWRTWSFEIAMLLGAISEVAGL